MRCVMKKYLGILLLLTACCNQEEREVLKYAQAHAEKLRSHFIGQTVSDVSTLVTETQVISYKLKSLKFNDLANKFNSYLDVLMYGNRTLDESVKDVQDLIYTGVCPCEYERCIENPLSKYLSFFK